MVSFKWWFVCGAYALMFMTVAALSRHLKRRIDSGIFGRFNVAQLPRNLCWIRGLALVGSSLILIYPLADLIAPDAVEGSVAVRPLLTPEATASKQR